MNAETLLLKKQTLIAWAKIMLKNGFVDVKRYNEMVNKIGKLTA